MNETSKILKISHKQKMSHIYIYSPSGAVHNPKSFAKGIARLEKSGHQVEIDPQALAQYQRFAGDDATRTQAIARACNSGADVCMISRGGYGLTRILSDIDWSLLHAAVQKGTQFMGFSDFTALQSAAYATNHTKTWSGPAILDDFAAAVETNGNPDCVMEACFDDVLQSQSEGVGWRMPFVRASKKKPVPTLQSDFHMGDGILWGGNLCILAGLIGTPYCASAHIPNQKGILFLEDVAEHPYRIERYLTQLLHAGILQKQQAIILGQFTAYALSPNDKGFDLQSVVHWLRQKVQCPVLTGLPMGHVSTKVCLPFGARVSLTLENRDALLFWEHAVDSEDHQHHHNCTLKNT